MAQNRSLVVLLQAAFAAVCRLAQSTPPGPSDVLMRAAW
jgi:hypothetical protein